MSTSERRVRIGISLVLTSLTALACEPDLEQAAHVSSPTFRSGTTALAVDFIADEHACFQLSYACDDPDSVQVTVDSNVAMSWTRPTFTDGEAVGLAPPLFCQPTAALTAGSHTFALTAVCDGTFSSDSVAATTAPPPFHFASLAANKTRYKWLDEIVLELDAGADNLAVTANFSAVDTTYTTGSETVQALGGGKYRIRRTMSASNLRDCGDYIVPVSISDGTVVKTRGITVRWLPQGAPRHALADATYLSAGAPTRTTDSGTSISSFTTDTLTTQSASEPQLFSNLVDDVGGRPFTLNFVTTTAIGATVGVEMRETGREGAFLATYPTHVEIDPATSQPFQVVSGLLIGEPLPLGQTSAPLQLRVVLPNGTASPWHNDSKAWPGEQGQIMVTGTVSYEFKDCEPDTNHPTENSPQYFPSHCTATTRPVRRQLVQLTNDCGQSHFQYTLEDGQFTLWLPDACGNEEFRVIVHSVTRNEVGKRVAVGEWSNGAISMHGELTDDPDDYHTHSAVLHSFTPGFGTSILDLGHFDIPLATNPNAAWSAHIIDNVLVALDYYGNFVNASDYNQINVVWASDGPDLEGSNVYLPSIHPSLIYLRPKSTLPFAVSHELAHYMHYQFMSDATGYGRFSEPMANTNAAMVTKSTWMSLDPDSVFENLDINGKFVPDVGGSGVDGFQQADLLFFPTPADFEDCDHRPACCVYEDDPTAGDPPLENIPLCVQGAQGWVWRLFLDLHDGTSGEPMSTFFPVGGGPAVNYGSFDGVDGGGGGAPATHKLPDVMFGYLGGGHMPTNPNRQDRGVETADLVDVLDGMMCRSHMTELEATSLLQDATNYDYDFAMPGGACI